MVVQASLVEDLWPDPTSEVYYTPFKFYNHLTVHLARQTHGNSSGSADASSEAEIDGMIILLYAN